MKKALCIILALTMVLALAACGGSGSAKSGPKTYTATHSDVDGSGPIPDTPFVAVETNSMANGYAGSFGNFVDSVEVVETLTVDGENYTYVWEAKCGTESDENPTGIYWATYTYTGTVSSASDTAITVNAPTHATFSLHSTKSMATNAEMVGYFGPDGFTTDSDTADCPYGNIPTGDALLGLMAAGTFNVSGDAITSFTAA